MLQYYAGWFLDHATAGPRTIKEGREEQQFPAETVQAAVSWYDTVQNVRTMYQPGSVKNVFDYEHFSRFETANRVWPPLVPATWLAFGRSGLWLEATNDPARHSEGVLTYRRDETAPEPPGGARIKYYAIPPGSTMPKGASSAGVTLFASIAWERAV